MKRIFTLLICFILFSFIVKAQDKIAFIYYSDNASSVTYKDLLTNEGFSVDLIETSNISTTDFSKYKLIVVSENAFTYAFNPWETPANVSAVSNSGLPIIGIGTGGSQLFEQMKVWPSWGQSALGDFGTITVENKNHVIFNSPKSITIPANNIVTISDYQEGVCPYLGDGIPANVSVLAINGSNLNYGAIVIQNSKYCLWSANDKKGASLLTEDGKNLFINVVSFMITAPVATNIGYTSSKTAITIYPNPAKDYVCVLGLNSIDKAEILTAQGQSVSIPSVVADRIDCTNLVPGIYIVKIYSEGKFYQSILCK